MHHQGQRPAQWCQLGRLGLAHLSLRLAVAGKQFGDPLLVFAPAHHAGEAGNQPLAGKAFRHPADQLGGLVGHFELARLTREGRIAPETFEHEVGKRLSLVEQRFEPLLADLAHQGIGILAVRQKDELELTAILQMGQRVIQCPPGRLTAGIVAVVTADHLGRGAKQGMDMVAGGRGSQRRHRIIDVVLAERHHIHIALHHQDPTRILVRLLDFVETEQLPSLVEDGRFGRVKILGRAIPQHPATEADDPAALVADREHDAIAEAVIAARAAVTRDQHAARDEQLLVFPAGSKAATHLIPVSGGIPDVEALDHLASQASAFQILHRLRRVLEIALVEARNLVHQLEQILADGRLAIGRAADALLTGDLHAMQAGQLFDGIGKLEPVVLHHKADGIAVGTAAETVIELLLLTDGKRGAFFVMKRAASLVVLTGFLQSHTGVDQLDNVCAYQQIIDKGLWDPACHNRPVSLR